MVRNKGRKKLHRIKEVQISVVRYKILDFFLDTSSFRNMEKSVKEDEGVGLSYSVFAGQNLSTFRVVLLMFLVLYGNGYYV